MYCLDPLQKDHKEDDPSDRPQQASTASTFKETRLDMLSPLSDTHNLYPCITNIQSHQSDFKKNPVYAASLPETPYETREE